MLHNLRKAYKNIIMDLLRCALLHHIILRLIKRVRVAVQSIEETYFTDLQLEHVLREYYFQELVCGEWGFEGEDEAKVVDELLVRPVDLDVCEFSYLATVDARE